MIEKERERDDIPVTIRPSDATMDIESQNLDFHPNQFPIEIYLPLKI